MSYRFNPVAVIAAANAGRALTAGLAVERTLEVGDDRKPQPTVKRGGR